MKSRDNKIIETLIYSWNDNEFHSFNKTIFIPFFSRYLFCRVLMYIEVKFVETPTLHPLPNICLIL
jgi:hypothetical protein